MILNRVADWCGMAARPRGAGLRIAWILTGLLLVGDLLAGPRIQSWETGNGAKVLFVEAPVLPMVDIRVVFDAGSARDGGKPGLNRLVNALLAEGAGPWNADQIADRLESVGAQLESSSLRDMAWVSARSLTDPKPLETTLETLSQVLAAPRFEMKDLERQREAMLIGLRLGEQDPGTVASKAFWAEVYGSHPYGHYSGGTLNSLQAITRDDLVQAYRRHYVARNAVIAIVGALTREQAEAAAEKVVSGLPAGEALPELPEVTALQRAEVERLAFPSSQTHIYVGQPGMRRGDPDYFPLYVGNHILGGGGLVSLLNEEVREKRGLSYSVYSYFVPMRRPGVFMIGLQTKNQQAGLALEVVEKTLQRFIDQGPSATELQAAKQNITGSFPLRIASNGDIVEYLAMIGFYDLPLDYLDRFPDRVEQVTVDQIRDAFRRRLQLDRFVTVVVGGGPRGDTVASRP